MAMTAKKIVLSVGLSDQPEYYSGRGAVWTDLSGNHLFGIYKKIRGEFGTNAGEAFVTMVENLKCLSATDFLNALYALEEKNWVYTPSSQNTFEENSASYYFSTFNGGRDDTEHIKKVFLAKLGRYPSRNELYNYHYYYSF